MCHQVELCCVHAAIANVIEHEAGRCSCHLARWLRVWCWRAEAACLPWGTFDVRYAAPETAAAALCGVPTPVTPAADLWSFGIVLYELATGRQYWHGYSEAAVVQSLLGRQPLPHLADPHHLTGAAAAGKHAVPCTIVRRRSASSTPGCTV